MSVKLRQALRRKGDEGPRRAEVILSLFSVRNRTLEVSIDVAVRIKEMKLSATKSLEAIAKAYASADELRKAIHDANQG